MKKKTILLLLGLITCLSFSFTFKASHGALSQDWIAIVDFKTDWPTSLGIDSSGNIYFAGYIDSFNGTVTDEPREIDTFLLKYDSLGTQQWNRIYDVNETNACRDLVLDNQDNIYLVGYIRLGSYTFLLTKYNSSGHLQWNKTWGKSNIGASIKIDSSNNIFVCGSLKNKEDIFLQKYDSSGNLLLNRTWETPEHYEATSMALDSSNNIYIGGAKIVNMTKDIILVKFNSLGEFQWNLTCKTPNYDYCNDIIVDSLDNIYVLGRIMYETNLHEIWLLKYDNSGNLIWNVTWGEWGTYCSGEGFAIDASDNIYITGGTSVNGASDSDVLILKYNSTGDLKWNYTREVRVRDWGNAIKIDSSENIYICGRTNNLGDDPSDYNFDAFLLKLSEASDQAFISGYNLPIVTLSVFGIGIAFYVKKRKSFS